MKEQESAFKKKVLKQFLSGENLFGKQGALAPILKEFLEEALQAEMEDHLRDEENGWSSGNKRNGTGRKTVKSSLGEVKLATPQDRDSSFEPKLIEKRQRILADSLEDPTVADAFMDRLVYSSHRIELKGESMRSKKKLDI